MTKPGATKNYVTEREEGASLSHSLSFAIEKEGSWKSLHNARYLYKI